MTATVSKPPPSVSYAATAAMDSVDGHLARVLSAVCPLPPRPLSLAGRRAGCDAIKAAPQDLGTVSFALQGLGQERPRRASLTAPLRSPAARRSFICGVLDHDQGAVAPAPGTSTHQLTALARSNALIVVPEPVTTLTAGSIVEVLELQP